MMQWASDVAGHDADVHAAIYLANQRILEEIGESRRDSGRILHVLQLRSRASDAPRDASDGSGVGGSRLEHRGIVGLLDRRPDVAA
jgi:hypothetical protein